MKRAFTLALAVTLTGGSMMGQAYEKGDWILRLGATTVAPDTNSDDINLPGGLVAKAEVDDDTQLGIIPAYMFADSWAIEVLAATPFEHNIEAQGQGAISGINLDAGSTKQLPPTIMVQWYPRGGQSGWQPYVGAGVNYTIFFDENTDGQLVGLLGSLTNGPIDELWAFNAGVWYIDIDTQAEITAKANGATAAKVEFDVQLDPWVYNVGIAYKF
jgi:outer membrane protein